MAGSWKEECEGRIREENFERDEVGIDNAVCVEAAAAAAAAAAAPPLLLLLLLPAADF